MTTKEDIQKVYDMNPSDLEWKPIYPNNMIDNGVAGMYALITKENKDGTCYGRKYSILYQEREIEPGKGLVDPDDIEMYILFEKSYSNIVGPRQYPEPAESGQEPEDLWNSGGVTLHSSDINSYGSFVRAYEKLEHAMTRALTQYQAVFGYAASHLVKDDE